MGKGWSVFFGAVLLACFLSLVIGPFVGWTLPKNVSSFGGDVDQLYYIILYLTGFFFILTEAILVYVMWKFAHDPKRRANYVHGNHRLEMFWTIIPAAILLYIAFAQVKVWAHMKSAEPTSWFIYGNFKIKDNATPDLVAEVTARQWEWRMRFGNSNNLTPADPRAWAENPESDDLHGVNELHTWKNASTRVYLRTLDVIHSFFLPNIRLKQDALPGRTIVVWFKPVEANCTFDKSTGKVTLKDEWEIACAELCGPRHYAMRGRLYVHETKEDYLAWLEYHKAQEMSRKPEEPHKAEKK